MQKMRRLLNHVALALTFAYFAGIIMMFVIFKMKRYGDDFEFAFSISYLLWGGVSLLICVFVLMVMKILITRD